MLKTIFNFALGPFRFPRGVPGEGRIFITRFQTKPGWLNILDFYFVLKRCWDEGFARLACLQSFRHFGFKFLGLDREMASKWLHNWCPGLILGAFCTTFRA